MEENTTIQNNINKQCNRFNLIILSRNRKPVTTSIIISNVFEKRHDYVLKKIAKLIKDDTGGFVTFEESSYLNSQNKNQKMFIMDRRSFSLLAMSFTGKKAMQWKHRFFDAFEQMERLLLQKHNASWQNIRLEGKQDRIELTDSIKKLIELGIRNNSKNCGRYYSTFTNMIYKKLFNIKKVPFCFRETLGKNELRQLQLVEWKISEWLNESLKSCNDYHEPYNEVKTKLEALIDVIGTINIDKQLASNTSRWTDGR